MIKLYKRHFPKMTQVFEKVLKYLMVMGMDIESTTSCHLMSIITAAIEIQKTELWST